jgi:hypothetical protein
MLPPGHETTATTTAAALYCISAHPVVEQQLLAELQAVLGDRAPTYDDLEHLPYLQVSRCSAGTLGCCQIGVADIEAGGGAGNVPRDMLSMLCLSNLRSRWSAGHNTSMPDVCLCASLSEQGNVYMSVSLCAGLH